MKRRREQKGTIFAKSGTWYLRYSDYRVTDGTLERKRLLHQLGSVAEMTKKKAREEARDFLATVNRPVLQPENAVTLAAFVDDVYMLRIEQTARPSTIRGYRVVWNQVKPFCADLWIRDVKTFHLQNVLDRMAQTGRFGKRSMQHIKMFLSGVFVLAAQQGYFYGANPATDTSIPKVREPEDTHAYSLEEVMTMIDALPEPAATMVAAAAFTGVRRGELRGMRWENYTNADNGGKQILIAHSIWNGKIGEPKSRKSKAPVPVIPNLAARLAAHRKTVGNPISGPIFPNEAGNSADPNNVLQRVILPALNVCEHCSKPQAEHKADAGHNYERNTVLPQWHGWHAFRRGLATNLNKLGVDDLTISRILRHSDVAVTQRIYIKPVSENAQAAMAKIETALTDNKVTTRKLPAVLSQVM